MIIGIAGAAGAGKDTSANALIAKLGYSKDSFARPLKEMLNLLFGWSMEFWDDHDWKEAPKAVCFGKSPREVAQTLGTEWGRNLVDENIWVDSAMRSVISSRTVFADVRFPNELKAIQAAGGKVIFVRATGDTPTLTEHTGHESESHLAFLEEHADATTSVPRGELALVEFYAVDTVKHFLGKGSEV